MSRPQLGISDFSVECSVEGSLEGVVKGVDEGSGADVCAYAEHGELKGPVYGCGEAGEHAVDGGAGGWVAGGVTIWLDCGNERGMKGGAGGRMKLG